MTPRDENGIAARLDGWFGVREAGSSIGREVVGGFTTFLTMSYIAVVNPVFLTAAGMPLEGVIVATLAASAFATILMGVAVNVPVALAPGMGLNAFFAYTICINHGVPWQVGLGLLVLVSLVFILLTVTRIREMVTAAVPRTLRYAAAVGIGLFITTIGLQHAGFVRADPATLVTIGDLTAPHSLLALAGLTVTLILAARHVRVAIFGGMLFTAGVGALLGYIRVEGPWFEIPAWSLPGMQMDLAGALTLDLVPLGIALLFFAVFDTMGTLYAVGSEAGLLDDDGNFPKLGRALSVDAIGALAGSLLGTSTVTCYIESATGVSVGARTGLSNLVVGACFIAAIFCMPLVVAIGAPIVVDSRDYFPVTAPALIMVGVLMARIVVKIEWGEISESVPAFLTMTVMPATFNISHGLAAGFVSYAGMKLVSGKRREVHWLVYAIAALFVWRYLALPLAG